MNIVCIEMYWQKEIVSSFLTSKTSLKQSIFLYWNGIITIGKKILGGAQRCLLWPS